MTGSKGFKVLRAIGNCKRDVDECEVVRLGRTLSGVRCCGGSFIATTSTL